MRKSRWHPGRRCGAAEMPQQVARRSCVKQPGRFLNVIRVKHTFLAWLVGQGKPNRQVGGVLTAAFGDARLVFAWLWASTAGRGGGKGLILVWEGTSQWERQQSAPLVSTVIWGRGGKGAGKVGETTHCCPRMRVHPEGILPARAPLVPNGGARLLGGDIGDKQWL